MKKKTIRDIDVSGKKILLRVDFNVPVDERGEITDDSRIRAALPTIEYLLEHGAALIIATHFGRPKGKVAPEFSVAPMARHLGMLLKKPVKMAPSAWGEDVRRMASALSKGDILMLENVRFHPGEEKNDEGFSKELASLAQIYVNDAFGAAHRAHSSTAGVASYLPSVAGLLMEKEVSALATALENPQRPLVFIAGGAKVADKLPVLTNLVEKVDALLIGGGMSHTFLAALGCDVANSPVEVDMFSAARKIVARAGERGIVFKLPVDMVVADAFSPDARKQLIGTTVPSGYMALDIGPKTIEAFTSVIAGAGTVIWNGPVGVFEMEPFRAGTNAIARAVAQCPGMTIVGGGDSLAALEVAGQTLGIKHLSTGGGASLEFLEGKPLPGVEALNDK
jgi:phosphoglycerate kinase